MSSRASERAAWPEPVAHEPAPAGERVRVAG